MYKNPPKAFVILCFILGFTLHVNCLFAAEASADMGSLLKTFGGYLSSLPTTSFAQQKGEFGVGTISRVMIDRNRTEPRFGDEGAPREFKAHIFYPSKATKGHPPLPYMPDLEVFLSSLEDIEIQDSRFSLARRTFKSEESKAAILQLRNKIITNTYREVPVVEDGSFPVVIFSPGLYSSHCLHTAIIEHLVSNGFVIVALEHTFSNLISVFPDGRILTPNPHEWLEEIEIRAADVAFAVEELQKLSGDKSEMSELKSSIAARLDLERIGVFGHSLGGGTALLAGKNVASLSAIAVLDGGTYGADLSGLEKPILYHLAQNGGHAENHVFGSSEGFATVVKDYKVNHEGYLDISVLRELFPILDQFLKPAAGEGADTQFIESLCDSLKCFWEEKLRS